MNDIQREAFATTKLATTYIINDEDESTGNIADINADLNEEEIEILTELDKLFESYYN